MNNNISAIVPMRANSERIINKNIKLFNGVPLYHYIIKTLIRCDIFDNIYIDTNVDLIKNEALKLSPKIKIMNRPMYLTGGEVPMNDVLLNSLKNLKSDIIIQTHCTNPLLKETTIIEAVSFFKNNYPKFDSLFAVTPLRSRFWSSDSNPINHDPNKLIRTQDLKPIYFENSNFYIFNRKNFLKIKNRIGVKPKMFNMNKLESFDIDDIEDFKIAESIQKLL